MLHLVRHGRPLMDRSRPADEWELDPAYADDVRALRDRLPRHAAWYSSPEPKAIGTALLLTEEPVEVVPDLREHERHTTDWIEPFEPVVRRAVEQPDVSQRFAEWGGQPSPTTPEEMQQFLQTEIAKWKKVAEARSIIIQ